MFFTQPCVDRVQALPDVRRLVEPDAAEPLVHHRPLVPAVLAGESPESGKKKCWTYPGSLDVDNIFLFQHDPRWKIKKALVKFSGLWENILTLWQLLFFKLA